MRVCVRGAGGGGGVDVSVYILFRFCIAATQSDRKKCF